jgi:hypothetical protein
LSTKELNNPVNPVLEEHKIEAIVLPNGWGINLDTIRGIHYNDKLAALRFTYEIEHFVRPQTIDKLSSRVRTITIGVGRVAVLCHRFFRYNNTIYIQDCDMRHIHK